jgi:hypothetical protein
MTYHWETWWCISNNAIWWFTDVWSIILMNWIAESSGADYNWFVWHTQKYIHFLQNLEKIACPSPDTFHHDRLVPLLENQLISVVSFWGVLGLHDAFFVCGRSGIWTGDFTLAKQAPYHLSHSVLGYRHSEPALPEHRSWSFLSFCVCLPAFSSSVHLQIKAQLWSLPLENACLAPCWALPLARLYILSHATCFSFFHVLLLFQFIFLGSVIKFFSFISMRWFSIAQSKLMC